MPSFYIPLSGLDADSTALNTIANNLSNMSTTGFKAQTTNFSDLMYQQIGSNGSGDEVQVGTGVQVASNSTDFTGGSIASTDVSTNVALNGTGFFVLDNNGSQLYTRDGDFQTSATGTLESSNGQAVMGYTATNGVVNTSGGLADLTIPTSGSGMAPSATNTFSMTQGLDSASAVGTTATGKVEVYDSLGKSYEATVTYTNLGDNKWGYAITLPDTLTAAAPTAAAATTMPVTASTPAATAVPTDATVVAPALTTIPSTATAGTATTASTSATLASAAPVASTDTTTLTAVSDTTTVPGTTTDTYTFAGTGTVNGNTSLVITGATGGVPATNTVTVTPSSPDESVAAYMNDITNALGNAVPPIIVGAGGVTVTNPSANQLVISGSTATYSIGGASVLKQDVANTTTSYNLVSSDGSVATIDPSTTLSITEGAVGPVSVPAFTTSEPVSTYATNLQAALTKAGITDVTVTGTGGVLSITGPSDMTITPGANGLVQDFSGTSTSYTLGSYTDPTTGLSVLSAVDPSSTLKITGPTASGSTASTALPITFSGTPETLSDYATDLTSALNTAGITGVTVTANATTGQLSIVGPTSMVIGGNLNQDMKGTTNNYTFESNATVAPTTNLRITGETSTGAMATITAPTISSGETVAQYASDLTSALSTAGIENVSVSSTGGPLSIAGANMTISGNVSQDLADTTVSYDFGSSATVDTSTAITIVGPTVSGTPATAITIAPTVTAGETVSEYAAALNKALTSAGIDTSTSGVSVTANGGQLSIIGPASTLKVAGAASQDLSASTISYDFGVSGSTIATVDPTTNLTITGLTATGATATIAAPTVTSGETLAQYATALNSALTTAGIAGVAVASTSGGQLTITGANITTTGSVIQDPVASTATSGTLTFDANGNLISPAANVSGITFAGLSDGSATMNMNWDLFGASGVGTITQTDTGATSSQSGQTQNGYASGSYNGTFTIGSDGIITADYSNGQDQAVGQIALATVSNEQGLADVGSTEYQTTAASGLATVGVASTDGLGAIEGSSLEASNVNISAEFSDLIVAQRAFEANAKSVTTFDSITQETINMIH